MRNGIIRAIRWLTHKAANGLHWAGWMLDNLDEWLDGHRKAEPKHRLTAELPDSPGEWSEGDDWLPPTPFVRNDACPQCASTEWPLLVYDGLRMCPVCKDEAVITDRHFGHTTGPVLRVVG